jgi:guanylate kinase
LTEVPIKSSNANLFIISSVAGGGKSTLIGKLLTEFPFLKFSISSTTRKPRKGDIPGISYNFLSVEEFEKGISNNQFLEWAKVHGNYYGTPRNYIESAIRNNQNIILDIDVQGARLVKEQLPNSKSIFILPPSEEIWIQRLIGRGSDDEESIQRRIENGRKELLEKDQFDYQIVNDDLETALQELISIIRPNIA